MIHLSSRLQLVMIAALLALAYALFRYRASRYRFFEEAGKEG